jgi:hypothetical protein
MFFGTIYTDTTERHPGELSFGAIFANRVFDLPSTCERRLITAREKSLFDSSSICFIASFSTIIA